MNLQGLAAAAAQKTDVSVARAEAVLRAAFDTIVEAVEQRGETVRIVRFGRFVLFKKPAGKRYHPSKKDFIDGKATKRLKFRTSRLRIDEANKVGEHESED
jgi:nucleoid DNA-binding protein